MVQSTFPNGFNTIELILQSPTVTPTDAAPNDNETFRTGISTQLSPQIAMAIHQIDVNIIYKAAMPPESYAVVSVALTEDLSATDAANELIDPRTLFIAGKQVITRLTTSGRSQQIIDLLKEHKLDPPIWTIAQQLNIIGSLQEIVAAAYPQFDVWLRMHYTLHPISVVNLQALMQRLNLSPQP